MKIDEVTMNKIKYGVCPPSGPHVFLLPHPSFMVCWMVSQSRIQDFHGWLSDGWLPWDVCPLAWIDEHGVASTLGENPDMGLQWWCLLSTSLSFVEGDCVVGLAKLLLWVLLWGENLWVVYGTSGNTSGWVTWCPHFFIGGIVWKCANSRWC